MPTWTKPKNPKKPRYEEVIRALRAIDEGGDKAVSTLYKLRKAEGVKKGKGLSQESCRRFLVTYDGRYWTRDLLECGETWYKMTPAGKTFLHQSFIYRGEGSLYNATRGGGEGLTTAPQNLQGEGVKAEKKPVTTVDMFRFDRVYVSFPILDGPLEMPSGFRLDEDWKGGRWILSRPGLFHIYLQGEYAIIRPGGHTSDIGDEEEACERVRAKLSAAVEYITKAGYLLGPHEKAGADREASSPWIRSIGQSFKSGEVGIMPDTGEQVWFDRSMSGEGEVGTRKGSNQTLQSLCDMRAELNEMIRWDLDRLEERKAKMKLELELQALETMKNRVASENLKS